MPRPKKPPPNNKRCTDKTKAGTRCPNVRLTGDDKCYAHSPKAAKARREARKKGGKNAHKPIAAIPPEAVRLAFKRSMDVVDALEEVFDEVRKGIVDYRIGQTLAILASTMLKALQYKESDDQDARIADLAHRLEEMKKHATNKNGEAKGAGQDRAVHSKDQGRGGAGEDTPGWLPDDEVGRDDSRSVAGEDAAEPLWDADADQR